MFTTDESNCMGMYLKEINKIPLLSEAEETELAVKARGGNKAAIDKLVNANLRFVVRVAKKYQNLGLDLPDLISEGNIGLMSAVSHFDAQKNNRFITYAVWWIRQSIIRAVSEKSRTIRLPLNRAAELVKIEHVLKIINGDKNEEKDIIRAAEMLGMTKEHVRALIGVSARPASLDAAIDNTDDSATLGSFIEDERYSHPEAEVMAEGLKDDIEAVLRSLKPREAEILRYRLGLDGYEELSLQEIGKRYNICKERIRQIEMHAMSILRRPEIRRRLESYAA